MPLRASLNSKIRSPVCKLTSSDQAERTELYEAN
jgi:hypothetical protein